ncbi:N-acetylmuramoyl-L-alanine amidase [Reichenbachiella agariperforans]|uniref:N-acetylmuramoyl-L-alanine amidase n=1 Tax=Reichenbachiella agariperforans TaxID=156994 RepID=A0A1M6UMW4_REIAG|nr:N-acetylmuramoyl-L-alanine amidase [Reichenbachiella agariperforans]SHK70564.1 N-acetylmuramoyl-L-alanine amidase [Reichenbachiella agariperforans]
MKIENHLLVASSGSPVSQQLTNKTSGLFQSALPDTVVIHYTAGRDAKSSVRTLTDPKIKASAHLVIGRDDSITQLVPFDTVAWHAGKSRWNDRTGLNTYSIGIEIDNAGRLDRQADEYLSWFKKSYPATEVFRGTHRNESEPTYWHRYTARQIEIVERVVRLLVDTYGIKLILGHEEISPGRKIDPGPAFPLDKLRNDILYADREAEEPETFAAPKQDKPHATVTAYQLNVRSEPSASSDLVMEPLTKGEQVEILERQGQWCRVKIEKGWVSGKYLTIKNEIT